MTTPPLPYPFFLLFSLSSSSSAAPPFLGSPHLRAPPLQPSPPLSLLCAAESGDAPVHLVLRRLALPPPVPHFPLHPPPLPCPCCAPPPTESGLTQQRSCTSPPIKGSVAPQAAMAQSITRLGQGHRASAYHLGPADCLPWLRGRGPLGSSRAVVRCFASSDACGLPID
ncbi:hypothetical protein PVAP13_2NG451203 [Panicum virgatum]|uniref:Uncharacterized protein n=1 Tax=Panicum virgatum TaxID=38727 RepID=A0A8T0VMJ8_PANVG|nr:hypothetical protein PVAP13_2NG451203 [Panicum virgatum]